MAGAGNYMTMQNLWQIEQMARDSRGMITNQTPLMPWIPDLISKAERDMTHVHQFFQADRASHGGAGYAGYGWGGSESEKRAPDSIGTCDINYQPRGRYFMNLPQFKEEPGLWCKSMKDRIEAFAEVSNNPRMGWLRKKAGLRRPGTALWKRRIRQYNRRCPKNCGVPKIKSSDFDGYGVISGEPMLKSQDIRLVDVFVIGPLMVYAASKLPKKHFIARIGLQVFGFSTILYNWANYRQYQRLEG